MTDLICAVRTESSYEVLCDERVEPPTIRSQLLFCSSPHRSYGRVVTWPEIGQTLTLSILHQVDKL